MALIAGEAGLGKTRLVDEIAVEARARGMFVVRGQCYDMEGAPPYAPFVEAIEYALNVVPRDTFRMAMGEAGPEIARFVPKVRVAYPDLPPPVALPTDQARHYMFESVCDFFEHSAAIQPLLMVLEDLHWADESTTRLPTAGRRQCARKQRVADAARIAADQLVDLAEHARLVPQYPARIPGQNAIPDPPIAAIAR